MRSLNAGALLCRPRHPRGAKAASAAGGVVQLRALLHLGDNNLFQHQLRDAVALRDCKVNVRVVEQDDAYVTAVVLVCKGGGEEGGGEARGGAVEGWGGRGDKSAD